MRRLSPAPTPLPGKGGLEWHDAARLLLLYRTWGVLGRSNRSAFSDGGAGLYGAPQNGGIMETHHGSVRMLICLLLVWGRILACWYET